MLIQTQPRPLINTDFDCQHGAIYYLKVISKDGATNRGNFECEDKDFNFREVKFEHGDFKYENGDKVEIWAEDMLYTGTKPRKVLTCNTEITAKKPHQYLSLLRIDLAEGDPALNCTLYSRYEEKVGS